MSKIILIFLLLLSACGAHKPQYAVIPAGSTVLVLGDSLSYGTGANKGEDYPALLATRSGWHIVNEGVPGDTTAGGLARLPQLLEQHKPTLIIVALGGNDFLQQLPLTETTANLKAILAQSKAQSVIAIMIAIPEFNQMKAAFGNLTDHVLYKEIAKESATPLIANLFSDVLSSNKLKSDQVHPNAKGYEVVSEQLAEKLKDLGFLK